MSSIWGDRCTDCRFFFPVKYGARAQYILIAEFISLFLCYYCYLYGDGFQNIVSSSRFFFLNISANINYPPTLLFLSCTHELYVLCALVRSLVFAANYDYLTLFLWFQLLQSPVLLLALAPSNRSHYPFFWNKWLHYFNIVPSNSSLSQVECWTAACIASVFC